MCFHICTINIRVSIRVRGLHLVFLRCTEFTNLDLHMASDSSFPQWCNLVLFAQKTCQPDMRYRFGGLCCAHLRDCGFCEAPKHFVKKCGTEANQNDGISELNFGVKKIYLQT